MSPLLFLQHSQSDIDHSALSPPSSEDAPSPLSFDGIASSPPSSFGGGETDLDWSSSILHQDSCLDYSLAEFGIENVQFGRDGDGVNFFVNHHEKQEAEGGAQSAVETHDDMFDFVNAKADHTFQQHQQPTFEAPAFYPPAPAVSEGIPQIITSWAQDVSSAQAHDHGHGRVRSLSFTDTDADIEDDYDVPISANLSTSRQRTSGRVHGNAAGPRKMAAMLTAASDEQKPRIGRARGRSVAVSTDAASGDGGSAGAKRFPCTYPGCSRVFTRAYNCQTHQACHLGVRPWPCHLCSKTFSRRFDLGRHLGAVHDAKDDTSPDNAFIHGIPNAHGNASATVSANITEQLGLAQAQAQAQMQAAERRNFPGGAATPAANYGFGPVGLGQAHSALPTPPGSPGIGASLIHSSLSVGTGLQPPQQLHRPMPQYQYPMYSSADYMSASSATSQAVPAGATGYESFGFSLPQVPQGYPAHVPASAANYNVIYEQPGVNFALPQNRVDAGQQQQQQHYLYDFDNREGS